AAAVQAISGRPATSASSLFPPEKRVEDPAASRTAATLARLASAMSGSTLPLGLAAAHGQDHLGHDRDGNLGRRLRTDIEADRVLDARECLLAHPSLEEPLTALGMITAAAECADVEAIGFERELQRLVVDGAHVGHDDHC